jgi:hypothetical protein
LLSLSDNSKKQQEEFQKASTDKTAGGKDDFILKHLKNKMNMNVESKIKI